MIRAPVRVQKRKRGRYEWTELLTQIEAILEKKEGGGDDRPNI